jgi:hypothetical protein
MQNALQEPWAARRLDAGAAGHPEALAAPGDSTLNLIACSGAQENRLSGSLDEYALALRSSILPSATRYLGLGGNQLTGAVPQATPPLFSPP